MPVLFGGGGGGGGSSSCTSAALASNWAAGSSPLPLFFVPAERSARTPHTLAQPEGGRAGVRGAAIFNYEVDGSPLALPGVAHVVDAKINNAVGRDRKILLEVAAEHARRDAKRLRPGWYLAPGNSDGTHAGKSARAALLTRRKKSDGRSEEKPSGLWLGLL